MAGAPRWKVYDAENRYQAACKEVEAAAAVVSMYGDGATIRSGHSKSDVRWTEGEDGSAGDSYDRTTLLVYLRCDEALVQRLRDHLASMEKRHAHYSGADFARAQTALREACASAEATKAELEKHG